MSASTVCAFGMALEVELTFANNGKWRGVMRMFMTHLDTRVGELEVKAGALPSIFLQLLSSLHSDFKAYHFGCELCHRP